VPRSWSKPRVQVRARLIGSPDGAVNAGSAAAYFVDLDALKFWDAIADAIAISILEVVAFADYDRGCTPDVISSNHILTPCS
jgi:hypothetical protein